MCFNMGKIYFSDGTVVTNCNRSGGIGMPFIDVNGIERVAVINRSVLGNDIRVLNVYERSGIDYIVHDFVSFDMKKVFLSGMYDFYKTAKTENEKTFSLVVYIFNPNNESFDPYAVGKNSIIDSLLSAWVVKGSLQVGVRPTKKAIKEAFDTYKPLKCFPVVKLEDVKPLLEKGKNVGEAVEIVATGFLSSRKEFDAVHNSKAYEIKAVSYGVTGPSVSGSSSYKINF